MGLDGGTGDADLVVEAIVGISNVATSGVELAFVGCAADVIVDHLVGAGWGTGFACTYIKGVFVLKTTQSFQASSSQQSFHPDGSPHLRGY